MDLYNAGIDGIPLEIETIDDRFEVSISRHEFPNADGALLENMGQNARAISIRCYFWDAGAHQTYADHITLINYLRNRELFTLTHPRYGEIDGMIESVSVRADDREMTAEIDLTFLENLRRDISELPWPDAETALEQGVVDVIDQQFDLFQNEAIAALGGAAGDLLGFPLDPELPAAAQLYGLSVAVREWAAPLADAVDLMENTLLTIPQPINSLVSTLTFPATLPGRAIGSIARMFDRQLAGLDLNTMDPSRLVIQFRRIVDELTHPGAPSLFQTLLRSSAASQCAAAVARQYTDDETRRSAVSQTPAFDITGAFLRPETPEDAYSMDELEQSLFLLRDDIQRVIDMDSGRALTALKEEARALADYVNQIKLDRERIMSLMIEQSLPLHQICLNQGLNYHDAERILRLNRIKNPSFCAGTMRVYQPGGGAA